MSSYDLFETWKSSGFTLIIKGGLSESMFSDIKGKKIESVTIRPGNYDSLAFLLDFKWSIKRLVIDESNIELNSIHQLANIESIEINSKNFECYDLKEFKNLQYLSIYYAGKINDRISNLEKLRSIKLNNYTGNDLSFLIKNKALENIWMVDARKLASLEGIQDLSKLKGLNLESVSKLTDISMLKSISELRSLCLIGAKNIASYEPLTSLENLNFLRLYNCAELNNIKFLDKLLLLDTFVIDGMQISDGNLSLLLSLPKLRKCHITRKKHYNISKKEIDTHINNNWNGNIPQHSDLWQEPVFSFN